jgi:YVTN family beta-propeller protein
VEADAAILIRRAAGLFVVGIIATGCGGDHAGQGREFGDAAVYVTVAVSDEVLRLDPETGSLLSRIPLDPRRSESDEPHGLAISPDGRHWYATLAHGEPTLSKFERPADRRVGRGRLSSAGAARVEIDPTGEYGFVADYDRARPGEDGEVLTVRLYDLEVVVRRRVCPAPHHALQNPLSGQVAVACSLGDEIVLLSSPSLEEIGRFPVDDEPGDPGSPRFKPLNLAWSPDGTRLYVALHLADRIRVFESDGTRIADVPTGRMPAQIALSPDGRTLVAANRGDGTLSLIDTETLQERSRVELGAAHPHGVALDDSGTRAFVSCEGTPSAAGRLVAVDLDFDRPAVAWSVETGSVPLGVAWAPRLRR